MKKSSQYFSYAIAAALLILTTSVARADVQLLDQVIAIVDDDVILQSELNERMKAVMNELEKSPDVILFIDELHTIVGAGGASGSLDASNMFKPALSRGDIQCIGATTLDEYRKYIETDGALDRRFQKVMVDPPSYEETIEILANIKFKCFDTVCDIGSTQNWGSDYLLVGKFPVCVNGYVIAESEGYETKKVLFSNNKFSP